MKRIKVCDSIMGSGKTCAAINMMRSDKDGKYIFITPYLDEVDRIIQACPERKFVKPSKEKGAKLNGLHDLLRQKENIVCTHSLFQRYNDETIALLTEGNYKLIMDEAIDIMSGDTISECDIDLLVKGGIISIHEDGSVTCIDDTYCGIFDLLMSGAKTGAAYIIKDQFVIYLYPIDVIKAFTDVLVLTYMFDAQYLKYYFDIYGIEYDIIGTHYGEGGYEFTDKPVLPEYAKHLKEKIHIVEDDRMNMIGWQKYDLSKSWFSKNENKEDIAQLRRNTTNFFVNRSGKGAKAYLWTTFKDFQVRLTNKYYKKSFVPWNIRATNQYREKTILAFLANIFLNPFYANVFSRLGTQVDEDAYALSYLVQQIWRSAIREGHDIKLYIPSKRMRDLLTGWMDRLSRGELQ